MVTIQNEYNYFFFTHYHVEIAFCYSSYLLF